MPSEAEAGPFAFGDVVLVPFPFTDQTAAKRRPAVIVSSRAYNLARLDVMVMAVTSQVRETSGLGEVRLDGWETAGLLKPSVVKPVVATMERGLIIRRLGALSGDDQAALRRAMGEVFG